MKTRTTYSIITVITVLIAIIVLNFLSSRHYARIDLTEKSIYTLAPATKSLLHDLNDVVTIRVYFTFDMPPALLMLRRSVEDVLKEFKSSAGDHLRIEYIDPASSPRDQQRAMMQGIAPVELNVIEQDRRELMKVYLGMTVMHGDRLQALPVVQTAANLEYRLVQAIVKVSSPNEIKIGWWPVQDTFPVGGGYAGLTRLLQERFAVEKINPSVESIDPASLPTLIIASSGDLSNDELFMIDQYLMKGGNLIALIDRWTISENLTAQPRTTSLTNLLARYGIEVPLDLVMDESSATAAFSGQLATYQVPYPLWPLVRSDDLSSDDPITAGLSSITLPWVSSIDVTRESKEISVEILAHSSVFAAATHGEKPAIDPETVNNTLREASEYEAYSLAVRVKGTFASAFGADGITVPKGRTPLAMSPSTSLPPLSRWRTSRTGTGNAEIIVVGSGRFAQDNFLARFPQNIAFIENAVDVLALGERFIDIRSRIGIDRPLAMLSDGERMGFKLANVIAGPVIVIIIAVIVVIARRMRFRRMRLIYGKVGTA